LPEPSEAVEDLVRDQDVTVTGWGYDKSYKPIGDLKQAMLPYVPMVNCSSFPVNAGLLVTPAVVSDRLNPIQCSGVHPIID
jgi:hypothetical protein